ncbi:MAG: DUF1287 domain-containing protein [Cocleimonas sp.]|nr:DUF1287 domain-containing protein [Cocleimonas sp.]
MNNKNKNILVAFVGLYFTLLNSTTQASSYSERLVDAAIERTFHKVTYDGSYHRIGFPYGDVPQNIGVCTDVVIRSYRRLGIDLQQRVNDDMKQRFNEYPSFSRWGLSRPDPNIDHRRVPNLRSFFERNGINLPLTRNPNDFKPGDIVTWNITPSLPHIGIVTNIVSHDQRRPLIAHNIGKGPKLDDVLFKLKMTGHYRYLPQ